MPQARDGMAKNDSILIRALDDPSAVMTMARDFLLSQPVLHKNDSKFTPKARHVSAGPPGVPAVTICYAYEWVVCRSSS